METDIIVGGIVIGFLLFMLFLIFTVKNDD